VDWDYSFPGSNFEAWDEEYDDKVDARVYTTSYYGGYGYGGGYNYGRGASSSKFADCGRCNRKNLFMYELAGEKMCWWCKEQALKEDVGFQDEGEEDTDPSDETTEIDYSSWDETMANEGQPAACDGCGETRYLLDEVDGRWLCLSCQREERESLIGDTIIDDGDDGTIAEGSFVGEAVDAVDAAGVFGAETEPIEDDAGGFLDDLDGATEYQCDRCENWSSTIFMVKAEALDEDDEYVCQDCLNDDEDGEPKEEEEETEEETEESSGGFVEEEETTADEAEDTPVVVDPLDRLVGDDDGRAPIH
jgi:hypothetical protein